MILLSNNWLGKYHKSNFEGNKKIGLIGVAGTKVKTRMPSTWWDNYEGQG
jgi:hypothetical protein